jgi:carbamoyl-phosphate synthase large subunit
MMEPFNVLISSAGRRVALLRIFRETLLELGLPGQVFATDMSPVSGAFHEADESWKVPRCTSAEFVPRMLELCRRRRVRLVVPTIDPELPVYAAHREAFAAQGTVVAVSAPEVIAIGNDKVRTHAWLVEHGFPTVRQDSVQNILSAGGRGWPLSLVAKPRFGSASIGVERIESLEQLSQLPAQVEYVVQSVAPGEEYTIDVLMNRQGRSFCAVPRKRLEVRGGEVSKAVTERQESLVALGRCLAEALPGAYGALNVQVFWDRASGTTSVIEINPRFGGGFPLTWQAGGHYPRWIIEEILGRSAPAPTEQWRDRLVMLRFDDALFLPAALAGL